MAKTTQARKREKRAPLPVAPKAVVVAPEPELEVVDEPEAPARPDEAMAPRERGPRLLVAAICALFVFATLRPGSLFANTTPTGVDLGGHVWGPEFLRGHLFDHGLLAGWSNDWFAGFPAYRFYMPVPALGAVIADGALPYGVAIKLMVALPLLALPFIAWRFARAARLPNPGPALLAIGSLLFLFDSSNLKYGGSIGSAVAGEYGNALAIAFALWCFAVFVEDLEVTRRGPAAGVLGALAACCHPVGLAFVVVGLLAFVGASALFDVDRAMAQLAHLGRTLLLVFLLSAFWYVPFLAFRLYTNDLNFERVTGVKLLFPLPLLVELLLAFLFFVGVVDSWFNQRRAIIGLAIAGVLFALAALLMPRGMLWNARLAPPWYLARVLVAAAGGAALLNLLRDGIADRIPKWVPWAAPVALALVVCAGIAWDMGTLPGTTKTVKIIDDRAVTTKVHWLIGPSHAPSPIPLLVKSGFDGYERDPHYAEYQALIAKMKELSGTYGCGRLMPENDATGRYGSLYADDLLPHWTDGCISTVTGLYSDSSPTSAFAFLAESALSKTSSAYEPGIHYEPLSLARGVPYLRELGARYYLASSPEAIAQARATSGLHEVATVGPNVIFTVDDAPIVQGLKSEPVVVQGVGADRKKWEQTAMQWFGFAQPGLTRVATSGPGEWERMTTAQAPSQVNKLPELNVTDLKITNDSVRFHVDRTGVPVLVRESYFPWWRVSGAQGPYRVAPNWMVVIPTKNDVVLHQQTRPVEWFATVLTLLGIGFAIGLAIWSRRRRVPSE